MGRPKELTKELMEAAEKYVYGEFTATGEIIPTVAGLAFHLGKSKATIYEYRDNDDKFRKIIDLLQARQEAALVNKGLSGDYNPTVCKLLLARHGYSDKAEIEYSGNDPFAPQVMSW